MKSEKQVQLLSSTVHIIISQTSKHIIFHLHNKPQRNHLPDKANKITAVQIHRLVSF